MNAFKPGVPYRMLVVVKCCLPAMTPKSWDPVILCLWQSLYILWLLDGQNLRQVIKLGIVTIELYRAHTPCALGITNSIYLLAIVATPIDCAYCTAGHLFSARVHKLPIRDHQTYEAGRMRILQLSDQPYLWPSLQLRCSWAVPNDSKHT